MEGPVTTQAPVSTPSSTASEQLGTNSPNPSDTAQQKSGQLNGQKTAFNQPNQATELFDIKVNGKTVKMTRQEVIDNASMAHAANDRFNEASKIRKEFEEKQSKYSKDPIQAFLDYTKTLPAEQRRKALEDFYMREYIEPETLSKEERAMREREAKISQWEKEQAERQEQEKKQHEEQLTAKERTFLQEQIIEAMEASGLPRTPAFVSRMAFYMRQNLINGWNAPTAMIVKQVLQEHNATMNDLSERSTPEQLVKMIGEKGAKKINAYYLQKLRESRNGLTQPPQGAKNASTGPIGGRDSREKISMSDVNRRLRDMRNGKFTSSG